MANDLINPLKGIVASAKRSLPQEGRVSEARERTAGASDISYLLIDVSDSMAGKLQSGRRKIDVLREAIESLREETARYRRIAFASLPQPCGDKIPDPGGSTALHLALRMASAERPARSIVISDGAPDDPIAALAAAAAMTGLIDTLYIGPDRDLEAIEFMRRLAKKGSGRFQRGVLDTGAPALVRAIQLLLPAPRP